MNKLLLIDDHKDNLIALSALLEHLIPDCSIVTAPSGSSGICIAEDWQPDTILLDIFMPEMDGYEACERLKSGRKTAHIPVILVTAIRTDSESRVKGLESGADAFLTKPIDKSELAAQINVMLRIKKSEDRLRSEKERLEDTVRERVKDLRRVNRALKTRSECNRAVAHTSNETDLLKRVCRIVVEIGGYCLAWIGYAENDEMKTVRPAARYGYDDGYIDTIHITWSDTEHGRGPIGTAIRTCRPISVRHIMTDPDFAPWRAEALKRGYSSGLALPLRHDGSCLGSLNIYAAEPDAFDTDELEMLEGLADDLTHGIMALRTRRKRREAEEALKESEKRMKLALEGTDQGLWDWDMVGGDIFFDDNWIKVLGYVLGEREFDFDWWEQNVHPDSKPVFKTALNDYLNGRAKYYELEYQTRNKSGEWRWIWARGICVSYDDSGHPLRMIGTHRDVTEYRQAKKALRVSEARFRNLLRSLNDVVWAATADGSEMLYINAAANRIYGRPPAEFLENSNLWLDVIHPDDRGPVIEHARELFDKGQSESEYRIVRPDGEVRWVYDRKRISSDETGRPVQIGGIATDITLQKQAEEALRESEERMKLILNSMPDVILQLDTNSNILWANKTALDMNPAVEIGKICYEAYPGKRKPCDGCPVVKSLETWQIEAATIYHSFVKDIRDESYWEDIAVPLKNDKGNVTGIIEIARNVTGRIMSEKALEKQSRDLRERVKELQCLYGIADIVETPGIILKEIFQKIADIIPGGWQYPEITGVRLVVEGEEFKTGNFKETLWKQSGVIVLDGEEIGTLDICYLGEQSEDNECPFSKEERDLMEAIIERLGRIIEREQAKKALEELNLTLEKRVKERTVQLEEMIDELKSFSYSVSHDLRAPLRAVNGFAQVLYEEYADKFDGDGRHYLEVVRSEAVRMGQLIDDLLAFSRLSRQDIRTGEVNMNELVDEVTKSLQFSEDGIEKVRFEMNCNLPSCTGDLSMLRQVWVNLLSNAVKYSAHNQEPLVETGCYTDDENRVVYFVRDNGAGFNMKYYDKLFGVFQRIHSPDDFPGMGIGLAIVKRIIQRHRGRVWAESESGKGATFYFYLSPQPSEGEFR
ncbi:PAS domain-containing protein [Desulfococcaceae bacterium HSG8]|nr:PAS domain-containing protein [Desulfococcaceae bacterium HSG8]